MPRWNKSISFSQSEMKLKSNWSPKSCQFRSPLSTHVDFCLMPPHRRRENVDPNTKNKQFSTKQVNDDVYTAINWGNSDPPHWNQVNLNHLHNDQINVMPTSKSSQDLPLTLKASQLPAPERSQIRCVNLLQPRVVRPNNKTQINCDQPHKPWVIRSRISSIHTLKHAKLDPPQWDQVYSDYPHETHHVNFDAHS